MANPGKPGHAAVLSRPQGDADAGRLPIPPPTITHTVPTETPVKDPNSPSATRNAPCFYTGNPGRLYNKATGLGVPNLAKFAADLAR
jgi:hypothetical protein